jgi:diadenosine tetraphosphatase ApaH/serine/threonine PP2A family protein phosphatase
MRVAVISDIHGNLHALEAVLAAIDAESPDAIWCLGDLVGYGPRPNECTLLVAQRATICLIGNHDLGVTGAIGLTEFSPDAAEAARWTRDVLDERAEAFLRGLKPTATVEGAELFHASPRDPVWEYILSAEAAYDALDLTSAPVVLVGHSHVALAIALTGDALTGGLAPDGSTRDLREGRWLLNPGSVGQPRDGDARAAYLWLDFEQMFAAFRRVPYPVEETQRELRERGLPESLAARLAHGQ